MVSALEADKSDLDRQCSDLKAKLTAQVNESNEMIINLQKELQDSRPQSQRFNFKLHDESVKQGFNNLESIIRQFVDKHVRVVLNTTDDELQNIWPNWSPQLQEFLTSDCLSSLALDGYIWECLLKRVFAPWSEVWPGELGQFLEKALSIAGGSSAPVYLCVLAHDFELIFCNRKNQICRIRQRPVCGLPTLAVKLKQLYQPPAW